MSKITTKILDQAAAASLASLISSHAQERKRGAPRQPDLYYAEALLNDRTAEVLGAFMGDELAAFATFFDLPESVSGKRVGHVDVLFVGQAYRNNGITKAMIEELVEMGQKRNWLELQWNNPSPSQQEKISQVAGVSSTANVRVSIGIHEDFTKVK